MFSETPCEWKNMKFEDDTVTLVLRLSETPCEWKNMKFEDDTVTLARGVLEN